MSVMYSLCLICAEFGIKYPEEHGTGDISNKGFALCKAVGICNCRSKSLNKLLDCALIVECHHVIDRLIGKLMTSSYCNLVYWFKSAYGSFHSNNFVDAWGLSWWNSLEILSPYPFHLQHLVPRASHLMWLMYAAAVDLRPPSWIELNYRSLALNWIHSGRPWLPDLFPTSSQSKAPGVMLANLNTSLFSGSRGRGRLATLTYLGTR